MKLRLADRGRGTVATDDETGTCFWCASSLDRGANARNAVNELVSLLRLARRGAELRRAR